MSDNRIEMLKKNVDCMARRLSDIREALPKDDNWKRFRYVEVNRQDTGFFDRVYEFGSASNKTEINWSSSIKMDYIAVFRNGVIQFEMVVFPLHAQLFGKVIRLLLNLRDDYSVLNFANMDSSLINGTLSLALMDLQDDNDES